MIAIDNFEDLWLFVKTVGVIKKDLNIPEDVVWW